MERKARRHAGFTLIELMISVAIIGILAATGMTMFTDQQMRSKRAEAMGNVAAIGRMVKSFYGETGSYPETALFWPAAPITSMPANWDAASTTAFGAVGFRPEGAVRFRYDVDAAADCGCPDCFTAVGIGDLDGDGLPSAVGYFHPDIGGWSCPTTFGGFFPDIRGGNDVIDETHHLDVSDAY
jgi:prepilin-type N-terminal cleavage/methylation domain-containing protein